MRICCSSITAHQFPGAEQLSKRYGTSFWFVWSHSLSDGNSTCWAVPSLIPSFGGGWGMDDVRMMSFTMTSSHNGIMLNFLQAFVFVVGGGNYIEYQNLQDYCRRLQNTRRVTYGTSELMNAKQFLEQVRVTHPPHAHIHHIYHIHTCTHAHMHPRHPTTPPPHHPTMTYHTHIHHYTHYIPYYTFPHHNTM